MVFQEQGRLRSSVEAVFLPRKVALTAGPKPRLCGSVLLCPRYQSLNSSYTQLGSVFLGLRLVENNNNQVLLSTVSDYTALLYTRCDSGMPPSYGYLEFDELLALPTAT
jgi:hypothetical protein